MTVRGRGCVFALGMRQSSRGASSLVVNPFPRQRGVSVLMAASLGQPPSARQAQCAQLARTFRAPRGFGVSSRRFATDYAGHLPDPPRQQRQGDAVLALGYPLGISGQSTLTRGVISAFGQEPSGVKLVQTDAALNPGNSGGPIVNSRGNIIAVDEFGLKNAEGLNFGIASETVQAFLD